MPCLRPSTPALTVALALLLAGAVPAAETADASASAPDGYIRDWLLGGPWPSYQQDGRGDALDTDFLGGEAEAAPYPGSPMTAVFKADQSRLIAGIGSTNEWGFTEDKTFDAGWKSRHFDKNIIVLNGLHAPVDDHFAVYAAVYVASPTDREIQLRIGSDDDHKVFLNGLEVGRHDGSQAVLPDQFIYDASLERGLNRLLLKVVDRTGDFGFCLAITDREGRPFADLATLTNDPRRAHGADAWDNGFAARFDLGEAPYFDGPRAVAVTVFPPDAGTYEYRLDGAALDGPAIAFEKEYAPGRHALTLEVRRDGELLALLRRRFAVRSREEHVRDLERARGEFAELRDRTLPALKREREALLQQVAKAEERLRRAYAAREEGYRREREAALADAPPPLDEALPPARARSRLCLNGPWEASVDRRDWRSVVMPRPQYVPYFLTWHLPLKRLDKNGNSTNVAPISGWEDFAVDPVLWSTSTWLRKTFPAAAGDTATFVAETIQGKAVVYLNGEEAGEYVGDIGLVEIPLPPTREGENTLEIRLERATPTFGRQFYGILGDLYVDFTAPVRVADTWVKTSWRRATLATVTELENRSDKTRRATLRQYAVRDGRIRARLPQVERDLPAGEKITVDASAPWRDPEIWGIGEERYGYPVLYELVSDLYVDGTLVDRHRQSFGFREFWIHATDFYLNGRRIILQGDVGHARLEIKKQAEVMLPLYRHDNINITRSHDSGYYSPEWPRTCDRLGMLYYAQMYPFLHERRGDPKKFIPEDEWLRHPIHQVNLDNYRRWHRMLRNNPSVVIWSTDNETLTQAWDSAEKADFNVRNDRLAAYYGKFVKSLDPSLVMTRNGDVGTWNSRARWFEDPPCDTANYHYPDFNIDTRVIDWQDIYEFRPVIFGETLYCSYGAWDKNIGPIPSQVAKKAARVRQVAAIYREQEIPAQIYMGLGLDGFVGLDDTGNGNPWGVTATQFAAWREKREYPAQLAKDRFPWFRIPWPAYSGPGVKPPAAIIRAVTYGSQAFNWFDRERPSHVRNAVNDAFRETLLPQPPLAEASDAECIMLTEPGKTVWCEAATGQRLGVIADGEGKAWFRLPAPGPYEFSDGEATRRVEVPKRTDARQPGFADIGHYSIKE